MVVFDVCVCSATHRPFVFPGVHIYSFALHPNFPTKPSPVHLLLCICYYCQIVSKQQFAWQPVSELLAEFFKTSSTTINRNGLSPDPCCRPTLVGNSSVLPCVVLTTVDAPWYVASTSLTIASLGPLSFSDTSSLGTLSYA